MDQPKILSGHALVAKGVTKIDASLPEIGLKDVAPNGSWLEQKQIQAALEARKHLVEVERIEKVGTLSHATWWDDLKLAEVTQKTGSHWQYLGHNVGKTLYLRPEEALFLMEVNCLLLKHGGVTISLQKAYSLLLTEPTSLMRYRVYASLSRIGYKVFRHKVPEITKEKLPSEKTDLNDKSVSLDENLSVDTSMVQNITEQPLTDSSVEIIESKVSENINTDAANQTMPYAVPINTTNTSHVFKLEINDNESSEEKSSEPIAKDCNVTLKIESLSAAEVEENDKAISNTAKNEMSMTSTEYDTSKVNNEEGVEISNVVQTTDSETQKADVQSNVVEGNTADDSDAKSVPMEIKTMLSTETTNSEAEIVTNSTKSEVVMDVDENSEIKTNNESQESNTSNEVDISDKSGPNEVNEETNSTKINRTVQQMDGTNVETLEVKNINNENGNKPEHMDISTDCDGEPDSTVPSVIENNENRNVQSALAIEVDSADSDVIMDLDTPKSLDFTCDKPKSEIDSSSKRDQTLSETLIRKRNQIFTNYVTKLKKLTSRQYKPSDFKTLEQNFENIPDLFKKEVITINVPDQQHIPKNIFVNKACYVLDLTQIKRKSVRSMSLDSASYNSSDEVNGSHVRRIRSNSNTELAQNLQFINRFPARQLFTFRPYTFWRPQNNYVQFNMFVQRPCYPNMYCHSRFQYQRPNPLLRAFSYSNNMNFNPNNPNIQNYRKRQRSAKATHLQSIKNLAVRLKQLVMTGTNHGHNIESLHRLLHAYNTRYKARLRLSKNFEVVNVENIVETIDLEDDEGSTSKKRRLSVDDMFDENFKLLKQLAHKLKDLEAKDKSSPKYRRAMSKATKTFNKSYDADVYVNSNFEVINRRFISIDSDSESDCVVSEPKKGPKKKKLRNPFNILKRLSEQQAENNPSTSKDIKTEEHSSNENELARESRYSEHILKIFNKNWLPDEDDFGRAEVVLKNVMNSHVTDTMKEEYIHNFIKDHCDEFNNWLEAKIAFLQHMEESDIAFQSEQEQMLAAREAVNNSGLKPLIGADDPLDVPSVLEKLRIIKNNQEIDAESNLSIHFDVYNRDVQNFKKTNPPKPHFRIICMEESSRFPSAAEVMALHSKYEDNVSIVFAIVGISAVSYLQINPIDLPVYVASNDLD